MFTRPDDPVRAPGFGCRAVADGGCSLRDAILASNANLGTDTIQLAYGATYQLSILPAPPYDATTGALHITDSVNFGFWNTCNNIFFLSGHD